MLLYSCNKRPLLEPLILKTPLPKNTFWFWGFGIGGYLFVGTRFDIGNSSYAVGLVFFSAVVYTPLRNIILKSRAAQHYNGNL